MKNNYPNSYLNRKTGIRSIFFFSILFFNIFLFQPMNTCFLLLSKKLATILLKIQVSKFQDGDVLSNDCCNNNSSSGEEHAAADC